MKGMCIIHTHNCVVKNRRDRVVYVKLSGGRPYTPPVHSPRRRGQGSPRRRADISPRRRGQDSPRRRSIPTPAPTPYTGKVFWIQGQRGWSCDEACGGEETENCIEHGAWPASQKAFATIAKKTGEKKCKEIKDSGDWQVNPANYVEHDNVCHWRAGNPDDRDRCGERFWAAQRYCPCKHDPEHLTTPTTTPRPTPTASTTTKPNEDYTPTTRRRRWCFEESSDSHCQKPKPTPSPATKAPTAKPSKPSRRRRGRGSARRRRRRRRRSSGSASSSGLARNPDIAPRSPRNRRRRRRRGAK